MTHELPADDAQLLALLPLLNKTIVSCINLKDFGYTKTQFIIFFALSCRGELSMSQLAGYISSSKEQATRSVAPLVDDGMIERHIPHENRTRVYVQLTAKGQAYMDQWKTQFRRQIQELFLQRITPEEKRELEEATETLIRILRKLN